MSRSSWAFPLTLCLAVALGITCVLSCTSRDGVSRPELGEQLKKLSETQDAFSAVASLGRDFVVSLTVREEKTQSFMDVFFRSPEKVKGGSGLVVHKDGWVLTNRHVVEGADKITVRFADGRMVKATDVLAGRNTDLAFVKIPSGNLTVATFGDSDKIRVGDWAIAIGSPFGFDQTVTAGIISARGRKLRGGRAGQYETFIQTDAAINSGNSGGPLLNLKGEVIGVNTAIYSHTNSYIGIGFAIPINRAKTLLKELIEQYEGGDSSTALTQGAGYVGIRLSELTKPIKVQLGLSNGVMVDSVESGGPGDKAGLRRYDIVTHLGNKAVDSLQDVTRLIHAAQPGTTLEIRFLRGRRRYKSQITVGKKP